MIKVLVTGSLGFIGKNLITRLSSSKYDVNGIDLEDFYFSDNIWTVNLLSRLEKLKPEVIFHVGACSDTLENDTNYMMEVNYESTKIISKWCSDNRAKLIYSSSAAIYGSNGSYPSNLYGWSKYAAEGYVVSNGGVALRYFNVYGPGEEHKGKMSSVAYQAFVKNLNNEIFKIFPGNPRRDFVYIKDVLNANLHALVNFEQLKGNWYDVGSNQARLFEDVLDLMGIKDYDYLSPVYIPEGYQYYTKSSKWMPGWNPEYDLEEGIKDYIKYLKNE